MIYDGDINFLAQELNVEELIERGSSKNELQEAMQKYDVLKSI